MGKSIQLKKILSESNYTRITGDEESMEREVFVAEINRPGFELAGFFKHSDFRRIILLGEKENAFIQEMSVEAQLACFSKLVNDETPCIIIAKGYKTPDILKNIAIKRNFPVFETDQPTGRISIGLTGKLDEYLAEDTLMHGVFLNIYGKGVIIRGDSGIGKSEIALELIKKGHLLIADDAVEIYHIGTGLQGRAPTVLRNLLEIRGIGIIDVGKMFGAGCVLDKDQVELIIQLERWLPSREYARIGLEADDNTEEILGVPIPKMVVPVTGGRSMAAIIEAAVMNMQLKSTGFDSSKEFVNRVLENIQSKKEN